MTTGLSSKVWLGISQVIVPTYLPLKIEKCSKCGHVIAKEKELIRVVKC
jgi:hypothetical protein